ncbi:MAG: hypothetical protein CSA26_07500 [Desulfobacterales bacterium]|nr:MAG: hypothetical protein CSA26_07500 [Desulfobacterales bacterium]
MKQAKEMTLMPVFADMYQWQEKLSLLKKGKHVLKFVDAGRLKKYVLSAGTVLFVFALFLAGSYFFLVQLAHYGW